LIEPKARHYGDENKFQLMAATIAQAAETV
jgi:hypothetical protein